jgi:hypothetical protein
MVSSPGDPTAVLTRKRARTDISTSPLSVSSSSSHPYPKSPTSSSSSPPFTFSAPPHSSSSPSSSSSSSQLSQGGDESELESIISWNKTSAAFSATSSHLSSSIPFKTDSPSTTPTTR